MAPVKKLRRLQYLHHSQEFRVPKSTYYNRRKRIVVEPKPSDAPSRSSLPIDPRPSTAGAESAPSCSREGSTSDKPLLEPEPVIEVDTLEDDLPEDINRDADPLPDSGCNSASDDLPGSVPHDLTEEEIFASAFAKLSTEKLPHLGTSKAGATAMAMSFAVAHGLTWAALGDLATLVNAIAGTEVLPRSQYMFRKLWSTKKDGLVEYWYLCDDCGAVLTVTGVNAVCEICNTEEPVGRLHARESFFVMLNVHNQPRKLIEKTKGSLQEGLLRRSQQFDELSDITNAARSGISMKITISPVMILR